MTVKPQLVLDLAGVLVSNFSPTCWLNLSEGSQILFQSFREQFEEIRKDLWMGKMKEEHFWTWLSHRINPINKQEAREMLIHSLEPLPAINCLPKWSQIADIHILSNHCQEWLEPILSKIEPFIKSITISNQVGLCKPDIQIYKYVEKHFDHNDANQLILFIDDQEKNFKPVSDLGWRTLLADQDHKWIEKVEPIILSDV
ncbi:haloacid dehalogenase [Paenibacillus woosongensis]|uniref:Haloacid dehalogenase n=1 Tax=Paenibacillus woosongensis TaxID=307580 RepID=A0AA95L261_9BACL|nr:haloacid dehalogenase [Paenibacillus woosongensis]WHX50949.1 haloacid dehalogenase [Paenibacillus woosongensis]